MTADGPLIGGRVQGLLNERGLNVAALHRSSGISERHLGDIVAGRVTTVQRATVNKLAVALDVEPEELLGHLAPTEEFGVSVRLRDADALRAFALVNRQSVQETAAQALHEWVQIALDREPAMARVVTDAESARVERARAAVEAEP